VVALGAALFVLTFSSMGTDALSRVVQGVAAGVGFVGGGAILKLTQQGQIKGLTTAAGLWLTAAVGVASGMGKEIVAILSATLALIIFTTLRRLEPWLTGENERSALPREPEAPPEGARNSSQGEDFSRPA